MHSKSLHKDVCIIIFTELYEAYKNFPTFLESADSLDKLLNFLQFSFYFSLFSYFSVRYYSKVERALLCGFLEYLLIRSHNLCVPRVKNKLETCFRENVTRFVEYEI